VRVALAKCEAIFRLQELKKRMKDQAAHACRALCRARVAEELQRRRGTRMVASPGLASSLGAELTRNDKLNAVIPAPVLYDQLISAVRSSSRLVALTNPTPEFFPDAAPALAQAKKENVQSTGYSSTPTRLSKRSR
jgi:hypothetical protein